MANGVGLRILSLVVRAFKSHPLHHLAHYFYSIHVIENAVKA